MKISISKDALVDALQVIHGVVGLRSSIPILSNVRLEAAKDRLLLTTTDLDMTMQCWTEAQVVKGGCTTLPARRLLSIVRELPSETVEIEVDEKHAAVITCGSVFFKIHGLGEDEFPAAPKYNVGPGLTMEQAVFKSMLQRTAYAASADESRYVLNGTLLSFKGNKLVVVATDGRRLALAEQEVEVPKEAEGEFIVPTKAVNEVLHSMKDEGAVKIFAAKNQIGFEFANVVVISKLIDGAYPNFRQVIPAQCERRVTLEREQFLNAVRRMAIVTSEKAGSVRLTFAKNKLKVSAIAPEVGEAHEVLPIKYTDKELTVAFNPEYIMDPLRNLTQDEVYLEMTDELGPGVIKCDSPFVYVLMPMRVS